MIQEILIVPIVAVALFGAVWKLMPAKRRLRVLMSLDARAARHSSLAGVRERLLKPRILRAAGSGCAGCAANVGTRPNHPPR